MFSFELFEELGAVNWLVPLLKSISLQATLHVISGMKKAVTMAGRHVLVWRTAQGMRVPETEQSVEILLGHVWV